MILAPTPSPMPAVTQTVVRTVTVTPSAPPPGGAEVWTFLGMPAAVWAGLLTGLAAIAVALINQKKGFEAQTAALATAHANALDLAKMENDRAADVRRQDLARAARDRHLDDRRKYYAKFPALIRERSKYQREWEEAVKLHELGAGNLSDPGVPNLDELYRDVVVAQDRLDEVTLRLFESYEAIAMMAPASVMDAASWLMRNARRGVPYDQGLDARDAFWKAARADLEADRPEAPQDDGQPADGPEVSPAGNGPENGS